MRRTIKICSLLFLLIALTTSAARADSFNEKRKTYSKSYSLSNNQRVKIANKFGKVEVKAWDRNEVKVDVTIIAFSENERIAQGILDNITIESRDGNPVTFNTKFQGNTSTKGQKSKMEINYIVYMPASNPLDIKNEFGSSSIPDWEGEVNIKQSFGPITTGKLQKAKDVNVEFGSLISSAINDGRIRISYSDMKIDNLSGIISSTIDFCKGTKVGLNDNLEKLDMKVSYSDVSINVSSKLNTTLNIKTSFGNLKNNSKVEVVNKTKVNKYGPTFDKTYSGTQGSGKASVTISSSFGDITLK
ncbi:hypothetical protein U0035_22035 [Niabella yanshanensis]|uniref:Adhesin domain-containing protein n=1 Tax=Niabella yanshanensis TaxID=577386 RepID=A0ABZ0W9Z6_9BACT|nr:hypothetical protein [Niabella yanshanensis]WQD38357.1 hypothetical protein U0035_22035 [Niabella yanshanensis]